MAACRVARGTLLTLVCVLATTALRCPPSAAARMRAVTLRGTVYLPNGRPAARVVLEASGSVSQITPSRNGAQATGKGLFTVRTDAHGRYRVELNPRRVRGLDSQWGATAPDAPVEWDVFLISQAGVGYGSLLVRAEGSRRQLDLDIKLRRGDRVGGATLAASGGRPVAGARVVAMLESKVVRPVPICEAASGRDGVFGLKADLPPGTYRVGATAPGWSILAGGTAVTTGPAQTRRLTLPMTRRQVTIRGSLLGSDGTPLRGRKVTILLEATGGSGHEQGYTGPRHSITTDNDGRFSFVRTWPTEEDYPWAVGYPTLVVAAEVGDRHSDSVKANVLHSARCDAVLTLR
jgi:hypothetical protein